MLIMASSRKRKPSSSTASRAKKPVRFVKGSATSAATPSVTKTGKKRRGTRAGNSRRATSPTAAKASARATSRTVSSATGSASGQSAARRAGSARAAASTRSLDTGSLPGWRDLAENNGVREAPRKESDQWLGAVSTARFLAVVLAVATLFTLYVGHVFATQELLSEVQGLRNEQLALEMTFDKLQGDYHRVTGPERISEAARDMGLQDRLRMASPIILR